MILNLEKKNRPKQKIFGRLHILYTYMCGQVFTEGGHWINTETVNMYTKYRGKTIWYTVLRVYGEWGEEGFREGYLCIIYMYNTFNSVDKVQVEFLFNSHDLRFTIAWSLSFSLEALSFSSHYDCSSSFFFFQHKRHKKFAA